MELSSVILQISFLIIFGKMLAFGFVGPEERKCKYLRVDKLLKIRCYDMNLKEVPQYLKTSVEVLDLSFNRIKKLKRSSFQPYTSVKYLLLYENMIQSVEPGTFSHLTSLQEIDLSNNALMTIPLELLQLPSLRNLYIDSNELTFLERDLEALETPIKAPLEYLNVADCGLQDIPDLGILPKLWHINASMNPLMDLSIDRFANLCNLKSIDLTRTQLSQCQCQQVNNHLRSLQVKTKFVPVCVEVLETSICPLPYNFTIDSETFQTCKTTVKIAEARSMWMLVAGCAGGVLAVILVVWYCIYRRRKRRNKKLRAAALHRKSLVISPKNAINRNEKEFHCINHKNELLYCDTA
ncbi:leucine-rich repeat-containing protein 4B-like [Lucilia sericata]|uniref:leucine-rich repeat-containing protein 4B-like n=1 Tax=Lucilia sericata TaxID=13632 RepID=UPI0018A86ED0|nr:leucine-rich repeat-containing protein 4B-like [Lucilia sericata]